MLHWKHTVLSARMQLREDVMKAFLGIGLFVVLGLAAAVMVGFYHRLSADPVAFDDEQSGLGRNTIIKFSYSVAENTPKGQAALRFAKLVEEKTKQSVKVELFPNGTLYNETDEIEALQNGSVQMIAPSFSNISEIDPSWMIFDLPFAFPSDEAVNEATQGDIGKRLFASLASRRIVGLAFWNNGFRQITSNKGPIIRPSDLKGLKFRIQPSRVIEDQYRLFDAKTFPLPFNQIYRSLENGTVDGEENSISNIYSKKLYQVQKYMTVTNHSYLGYAVLINKTFWDKLSPDMQKSIREAMDETTAWANRNAILVNQSQWEDMQTGSNIQIYRLSKAERDEWKRALLPVANLYKNEIGRPFMLDLEKIREQYADSTPSIQ
jgi:tripartite ATP-independent transporter DctP family solute receptor